MKSTPRSSRAPTARDTLPVGGTRYIFANRARAPHRWCRLSSKVRGRMDSFLPILALLFFWRTAVAIPVAFVLAIAFAALHGSRAATAWRLYLSRSTPGCCGTAQRVRVAESGPPQRQSNCLRQCLPSIWSFWVRLLKLGQVPPPVLWLRERSHWSLKQRQLACRTHACEGAPSHGGHLHT